MKASKVKKSLGSAIVMSKVCRAAGMNPGNFRQAVHSDRELRPDQAAALNEALDRVRQQIVRTQVELEQAAGAEVDDG